MKKKGDQVFFRLFLYIHYINAMLSKLIPNEILEKILRSAVEDTWGHNTHHYALVCRSWCIPACSILYEEIDIPVDTRKLLRCLSE